MVKSGIKLTNNLLQHSSKAFAQRNKRFKYILE